MIDKEIEGHRYNDRDTVIKRWEDRGRYRMRHSKRQRKILVIDR